MTNVSISKKEKQGLLASVLRKLAKEPVALQEAGEDVAIVLSPEQFEAYAKIRKAQIDDFFVARKKFAASAKRKGLTKETLDELLGE